jgi:hypothetical protein
MSLQVGTEKIGFTSDGWPVVYPHLTRRELVFLTRFILSNHFRFGRFIHLFASTLFCHIGRQCRDKLASEAG